jgi:hypothetical protein
MLLFSLLVGATLETLKSNYALGERVTVSGSCNTSEVSVGLQANLGDVPLWVDQQTTDNMNKYSASFVPFTLGNYTLMSACFNQTANNKVIYVGTALPPGMNCVPGVKECDGNAVITCNSEGQDYSVPIPCAATETCSGGVCLLPGTICVPSSLKCNGALVQTCASDGKTYSTPVSCGDGKTCSDDVCIVTEGNGDGTPSGSGNGPYYDTCRPSFDCGAWSYCGASLKQSRICNDVKGCKPSYTEEKVCTKCEESWICSAWSTCQSDEQLRTCYDEHKCGSTVLKPTLRKYCQATYVPGPKPASVSSTIQPPAYYPASQPEPAYQPPVQKPVVAKPTAPVVKFSFSSFWDKYQMYFLGLGILIVVVIIIIILIAYFAKPKQRVYNLDELKEWIEKERQMNTGDVQIRQILSQNTGWSEEEISQAFSELRTR